MGSNFTAIYDACVLYPAPLRDLLMQLAQGLRPDRRLTTTSQLRCVQRFVSSALDGENSLRMDA